MDHRVQGVDHVAFPTFDPAGDRALLPRRPGVPGGPLDLRGGLGPGGPPRLHPLLLRHRQRRPNRVLLLLRRCEPCTRTGAGDVYARFGPDVPDFFVQLPAPRHPRRRRGGPAGVPPPARRQRLAGARCRSSTRRSSRSTPTTPTATWSRSPARCGRSRRRRTSTPNLTIDALLDVVAEPEPTFGKLLARKAELIVERAADVGAARVGDDRALRPRRAGEHRAAEGRRGGPGVPVGRIGPYFEISRRRPDRDRPTGDRLPARRLVLRRGRGGSPDARITQHDKDALRVEPA